jgi:lysozyme
VEEREVNLKHLVGAGALVVTIATSVIAPWEGMKTRTYIDIVGVPTVCYGETRGVRMGDSYTPAQCLDMLEDRVQEFYVAIDPCMPDDLPAKSQAAFVSLAYNIGEGVKGKWGKGFCSSKSIQGAFARGDYKAACNAILQFNKGRINGKLVPIRGLTNRRTAEHKLCLQGLAEAKIK